MATQTQRVKKVGAHKLRAVAARKVYVVATNADYAQLCRDTLNRLGKRSKDAVDLLEFTAWNKVKTKRTSTRPETFFVSRLADISAESAKQTKAAGKAKYLLFSEDMPIESLATRLTRLDIRDEHRLHVARERNAAERLQVIHRLLSGVSQAAGAAPILDAWIEQGNLVVLSPSFERLIVPLAKLSKYIGEDEARIGRFHIDEDGSFLQWDHADVHLGWEQLLYLMDPAAAMAAHQRSADFNRRYGAAIRSLREHRGLNQSQIPGLTERHLRRIEHGEQAASKATLEALAAAHRLELADYLGELATRLP